MLGQFTRKEQTDSGLNFSTGQSSLVVVTSQIDSFIGQSLENIVDERVHDAHSTLADTHIGVDLLQHTVDVGGVRLQSSSLAVREISLRLRSLSALARSLGHFYTVNTTERTKATFKPYSFRFKFYLTFQNTIILVLARQTENRFFRPLSVRHRIGLETRSIQSLHAPGEEVVRPMKQNSGGRHQNPPEQNAGRRLVQQNSVLGRCCQADLTVSSHNLLEFDCFLL